MDEDQRIDLSNNSVADYYNTVAETWDSTPGAGRQNERFSRQLRASLMALLTDDAGSAVALELGVGTGPYVGLTAPLFGKLIALDVSSEMLAVLAQRISKLGLTNVELLRQDACDLPDVQAASVDVVYSIGVLETVEDYDRLFMATDRVLKPGGLVAGITSNGRCPWYWFRDRFDGGQRYCRSRNLPTAARIKAVLRRSGFDPPEVSCWGAVPAGMEDHRVLEWMLATAESMVRPTPLSRYLGALSFRARKLGVGDPSL